MKVRADVSSAATCKGLDGSHDRASCLLPGTLLQGKYLTGELEKFVVA